MVADEIRRIDELREHEPVGLVCPALDIPVSSYYEHFQRRRNRPLMGMMRDWGHDVGRFKILRLLAEADLVSKPPGAHGYKVPETERVGIANPLDRELDVPAPNRVWCGDITYT